MEKLLGPKGSKLFEKRKDKTFVRKVEDLAASMRGFQKEPGNLKEYSPWLSGFKADTFSNELEIPGQHSYKKNVYNTNSDSVDLTHKDIFSPHIVGQYDGRSKPLPEYHAKITGFDERVRIGCRQM